MFIINTLSIDQKESLQEELFGPICFVGHLLFIANTARIVELIGKVKETLSEDRILIQSSTSFALIK